MIWGGAEEIEKKKFLAALLQGKKNFGGHSPGKENYRQPHPEKKKFPGSLCWGKKKFLGPFLIGLYKEKKFFGVHLWEKKIWGKPPRRKKNFWEASLKKKKILGSSSGEKKFLVNLPPQIINGRPLSYYSAHHTNTTIKVIILVKRQLLP